MNPLQRLWDSLGFNERFDEAEYDYVYEEDVPADSYAQDLNPVGQAAPLNRRDNVNAPNGNVIGMPGLAPGQTELVLMEPRSFEEIPQAVAVLRSRKSVILNLGLMDADAAQRSVDFVAGGAFAIDGQQQRLGDSIFLFTPSSVQISNYSSAGMTPPTNGIS